MKDIVLKTHKLCKKYGSEFAVNNISITINKGDIYGFIGRNGAGKTTLIRMITGLIHKTSGEIELLGSSGNITLDEARSMTGSVIETPTFYGDMTARENLEVSTLVRNIPGKQCIEDVLNMVGLKDVKKKKVKNFSLGMRQRLGIANALLGNPRLLILDEPINGLDPVSVVKIRELLKKINKEKETTILISSHILSELSELATCYGIINNGKLVEEITSEELSEKCKQYIELKVNNTKGAVVLLETELDIKDYVVHENNIIKIYSNLDDVGKINTLLSTNGIIIEKILSKGQNLEEYFLNVIGDEANV
ncbi:ABC transporter ATP-binding protein [Clostridium pasteurianum]|uniref:ABC-type multidrug transport system, ATPase component n=1 Tax=Clostridium pasteurianum BC1 TaxID=86416 RepID=R4JYU4_CLOPA|nr:ABC transporter ATP-binding protein [Clostridium pasteurianum]AGK95992.1 ABC-type multidrug transport system, ATPase component [Clostridium pasteurianum BC1]